MNSTEQQRLLERLNGLRQRITREHVEPPHEPAAAASTPSDAALRAYESSPCETLVVAFGSLGGQHDFQGSCKRAGVCHTYFVRDLKQSWFLLGLGDKSDASFAATLGAVAAEVQLLQPRRLVLLGTSMGGYAAVRAALELLCDVDDLRVLAFAPQIVADPEERAEVFHLPPMPFDANLNSVKSAWLAQGRSSRLPSAIDALYVQHRAEQRRCVIEVHVGALSAADVCEAELLRCAASEHAAVNISVRVVTHEGMGHRLAEMLRDDMELEPLLTAAVTLDLQPRPPWTHS